MNRRTFTQLIAGTVTIAAVGVTGRTSAQASIAGQVHSEWGIADDSDNDLERFETTITAYESEAAARQAFDQLLRDVDGGNLHNAETGAETLGDESFFVEYFLPYLITFEVTIRLGTLVYQFRWDGSGWDTMREAHRLMTMVFERAEVQETYSEDELTALLPTEDEVLQYGLTELLVSEATPTP